MFSCAIVVALLVLIVVVIAAAYAVAFIATNNIGVGVRTNGSVTNSVGVAD